MSLRSILALFLILSGSINGTVTTTLENGKMALIDLQGQPVIRVRTIINPPFAIMKDGQISGFVVDLLDKLTPMVNAKYNISLEPDGMPGDMQNDRKWNGLVGSLIDNTSDVAACDLTITSAREKYIDFLTPFKQSQIRILISPKSDPDNVRYLVWKDTSFQSFLKSAKSAKLKKIWLDIDENYGFVSNTTEGVEKVLKGGYAMVSDTSQCDSFVQENNGNLQYDRDALSSTYLAFGVQQGSPWREILSEALEKFSEEGELQALLENYDL